MNQFFLEQVAYVGARLDAIQEGDRTLLDNTSLLFCSSMMTGSHDATKLPVVLLGKGGGKLRAGRVVDCSQDPSAKCVASICLWMEYAGVSLPRLVTPPNHSCSYLRQQVERLVLGKLKIHALASVATCASRWSDW